MPPRQNRSMPKLVTSKPPCGRLQQTRLGRVAPPSIDAAPTITNRSHHVSQSASLGSSRARSSADFKPLHTSSPLSKNYGSVESVEPAKRILAKDGNARDESILSEIDHTMRKYSDNLLHALEGVSVRLTQLETGTRDLEESVDEIKVAVGNNHGSTDGKMRQLENILREVEFGVQILRDKHEIIEAHLQVRKLQVSHTNQCFESLNAARTSSTLQAILTPMQETASQQIGTYTPHQDYQQPKVA